MTIRDDTTLLVEYLDVCNTALAAQKDAFPHKQVLALSKLVFGGRSFSLLLYDEDPDLPSGCFTIRFCGNQLELVAEGKQHAAFSCKVKRGYLRTVTENRQDYIDHPEKLDWDWLKSRLGFGHETGVAPIAVKEMITRELEWVAPQASVREAAVKMKEKELGAVAVMDGGRPVGMLTDRDITLRVVAGGLDPDVTSVDSIMSRDVLCCPLGLAAESAAAIMQERGVRRLLVLDVDSGQVHLLSLDDLAVQFPDKRVVGETLAKIAESTVHSAVAA